MAVAVEEEEEEEVVVVVVVVVVVEAEEELVEEEVVVVKSELKERRRGRWTTGARRGRLGSFSPTLGRGNGDQCQAMQCQANRS